MQVWAGERVSGRDSVRHRAGGWMDSNKEASWRRFFTLAHIRAYSTYLVV
jgi:hypothetical protein